MGLKLVAIIVLCKFEWYLDCLDSANALLNAQRNKYMHPLLTWWRLICFKAHICFVFFRSIFWSIYFMCNENFFDQHILFVMKTLIDDNDTCTI